MPSAGSQQGVVNAGPRLILQEYHELGECRNWAVSVRAGSCVPALRSPQAPQSPCVTLWVTPGTLISLCHARGCASPHLPFLFCCSSVLAPPVTPSFAAAAQPQSQLKADLKPHWFPADQNKVWQIMKLFCEAGELHGAALASEMLLFRIIAGDAVVAIITLQIRACMVANLGPCLLCSSSTSK